MKTMSTLGLSAAFLVTALAAAEPAPKPGATTSAPVAISGIYPHLAMFNAQGECGVGAVVPWADRLWVVTYSPHMPQGSDDKLYEITKDLQQIIRPESIGGTPANRLIHQESNQLFIGPYAIDAQRRVRAIPYEKMFGRTTGNARHLTDPANKIYYASMEEGIYEVDVRTLAVTELFRDEQVLEPFRRANLPGYHGKGLYSGQGRLIYANNGENSPLARQKPDIPSGVLAEWDGRGDTWTVVRRNQFTEVTGPGGLTGNAQPATDPVWSIGWDHRSLLLQVLDRGAWHTYRLPKASHTYDGAHGWNTEWPRIRDIGEPDLLLTMHGSFWHFPRNFDATHATGIRPRSNYLKIVGDFSRWGDRLVLGCDDTAKSEFLNKRRVKGGASAPGQSQSNLWFLAPAQLDQFGPALGRGAVWIDEPVKKDQPSDAFLLSGFAQRVLHLRHDAGEPVIFTLEVDRAGDGRWNELRRVEVPAAGYAWFDLSATEAPWICVRAGRELTRGTAVFAYRNADQRTRDAAPQFAGLLRAEDRAGSGGLLHARGDNRQTLGFAATTFNGGQPGPAAYYEMGADLQLRRAENPTALSWMQQKVAIPRDVIGHDAASVIYTDEEGRRFRLPRGRADFAAVGQLGAERVAREVVTERDVLNCGGTFFELPAENAGGIAKVRPITTHNRRLHDFASWRGLMIMTGVAADAPRSNAHIIRSTDGAVALWAGTIDDLWSFGKAVGVGGPWKDTAVAAGVPSDPYLFTGYDQRKLTLSHKAAGDVRMKIEADLTGTGLWVDYATLVVPPGQAVEHAFPSGYQAYWLRISVDTTTTATAWLNYD